MHDTAPWEKRRRRRPRPAVSVPNVTEARARPTPEATAADRVPRGAAVTPATRRFLLAGAGGIALGAGGALLLGAPPIATAAACSALALAIGGSAAALARAHPHPALGAANLVTLGRLVLVSVLLSGMLSALAGAPVASPPLIAMAVIALVFDGVDGRLARRQQLESPFGARFDMEVDSAFALVLAVLAALGPAGPLALLLGMPRYLFWAAGAALPWLDGELEPRYSRKVVCVVQLIALIALLLPGLPPPLALGVVAVTAALLAWSFGRDIVFLHRARSAGAA
jgi:phosphatidylglycerophosphate synthase